MNQSTQGIMGVWVVKRGVLGDRKAGGECSVEENGLKGPSRTRGTGKERCGGGPDEQRLGKSRKREWWERAGGASANFISKKRRKKGIS